MFEGFRKIKRLFHTLFVNRISESDGGTVRIGLSNGKECEIPSETKQVEDKKAVFRENIKKKWKPSSYNLELISNDVKRRTEDLKRDYTDNLNRQDCFTIHAVDINYDFVASGNLFKSKNTEKICSMMEMYVSRKNSVVCPEWDKLKQSQLDLFLRTHKVLDRKNILAAKELMEEIGRNMSLSTSKAEKSALKIVEGRIAELEKERKKRLEEKQKKKFKDNFKKS